MVPAPAGLLLILTLETDAVETVGRSYIAELADDVLAAGDLVANGVPRARRRLLMYP
jgi:hypothetical protein